MMRIDVVVARRAGTVDAIRAYAEHLVEALIARGQDARLVSVSRSAPRSDVTLLQYNPFSYGRRGVAPGLVLWALRARWSRSAGMLALMVHEPYVASVDARTRVMAAWQRPQLLLLRLIADCVLVPSAEQARRCGTRLRRPRVVPVGSNLPHARGDRSAARAAMGMVSADIVLVSFAASPAGRRQDMICAAARSVVASGRPCVLLVLGINNMPPPGLPKAVRVVHRGHLETADVAQCLAAGDIFLAPYVDGVSTRRTALMSALQHSLPVVGTIGPRSDRVLLESEAIAGVPVDAAAEFARETARLAAGENDRQRRGAAARALFEREFTWDRIAERLLQQLR